MEAPSNVEPIRFTLPFVEIASKISFRFRNVKKTFGNYAFDSLTCRAVLLAKNELAKNEKERLCNRQCATGMAT